MVGGGGRSVQQCNCNKHEQFVFIIFMAAEFRGNIFLQKHFFKTCFPTCSLPQLILQHCSSHFQFSTNFNYICPLCLNRVPAITVTMLKTQVSISYQEQQFVKTTNFQIRSS
jgi:hypothetical protein